MNAKQVRATFLDFFRSKGHDIVLSAPMVIKNDPTLMFTNAGMNQFKDLFLGNAPIKHSRIADTQKCLRVSGKHNDLEEVGHDTYHHTMFEMLGNWSFGDYFKKEAIDWAWELLTEVYKLPTDRLYATVFEGSKDDGTEKDQEAYDLWNRHLPENHILLGNKKDNFWEMGATGPCGPCSELHIDLRDDDERKLIDGALLVNKDNPLVIEIWNLVFMQFNRKADGELVLLPAQHVDTGMGFERLCMALQGKKSNYDTDIFQPIITSISSLSGKKYGHDIQADIAMRVIADHLRAISFSIADGQLPSNNKAGYVIRRILRRAVRYGYTFLGFHEAFMYKLVTVLVSEMGEAFPELVSQKGLIEKVIHEEEASFLRTLDKGIRLLENVIEKVKVAGKAIVDGASAFELYDTYGFPIDLTELILKEQGMTVDLDAFAEALDKQKKQSQHAAAIETGDWVELQTDVQTKFVGYDCLDAEVRVVKFRTVKTKGRALTQLVLDQTSFYAESGGQLGDTGTLESVNEKIKVLDTIKENNLTIHLVDRLPEAPQAVFLGKVDKEARLSTENNHTATHLLHFALRQVLGTHVEQKGSQVSPKSLRFDFSHFQKVSDEELLQVESLVNKAIRANTRQCEERAMPIEDARKKGAMALFGEKYGDSVRVIQFGDSVELCGGTHAAATGQIGLFKIVSEAAVSAGIRRIEAFTGAGAELHMQTVIGMLKEIKAMFNNSPALIQSIQKTIGENADLKKEVDLLTAKQLSVLKQNLKETVETVNGIKLIKLNIDIPAEAVKNLAYQLKGEIESDFVFAAATNHGNRPLLTLLLSDGLLNAGKNAGAIIREAAKEIGGSGGGQAFFATAGGKESKGLQKALDKMIELATK